MGFGSGFSRDYAERLGAGQRAQEHGGRGARGKTRMGRAAAAIICGEGVGRNGGLRVGKGVFHTKLARACC